MYTVYTVIQCYMNQVVNVQQVKNTLYTNKALVSWKVTTYVFVSLWCYYIKAIITITSYGFKVIKQLLQVLNIHHNNNCGVTP